MRITMKGTVLTCLRQSTKPLSVEQVMEQTDYTRPQIGSLLSNLQGKGILKSAMIHSDGHYRKYYSLVDTVPPTIEERIAAAPEVIRPEPVPTPTPVEEAPVITHELKALDTLLDDMVAQVIDSIFEKLVNRLTQKKKDFLTRMAKEIQTFEHFPTKSVTDSLLSTSTPLEVIQHPVKKKIGIVGLRFKDFTQLNSSEIGQHFELQFWDDNDGWSRLRSIGSGCEKVMVCTRFVSHAWLDHLKTRDTPILYNTGGVSQAKRLLSGLLNDQGETSCHSSR